MSHANAALTPRARLRLARLVIDQGLPITRAAERHDVSGPTAKRWADRYQVTGARDGRPVPRLCQLGSTSTTTTGATHRNRQGHTLSRLTNQAGQYT